MHAAAMAADSSAVFEGDVLSITGRTRYDCEGQPCQTDNRSWLALDDPSTAHLLT